MSPDLGNEKVLDMLRIIRYSVNSDISEKSETERVIRTERLEHCMDMYTSIKIDFEVYKAITMRRESPGMTENDVLREMLGLPRLDKRRSGDHSSLSSGREWVWKDTSLPEGTELRAEYKGRPYTARIEDGSIVVEGKEFHSPSAAAAAITGGQVNGWKFWKYRPSEKDEWRCLINLRQSLK
ncbi:MAG: DUF4357 domain-containing protein [Acidobacteria bacterium]|nr:DUF4357 domain-containing protein [Acidobacteriota bacterium]